MSKKRKHRSKPASNPYNRSEGSILADERDQAAKKFNPKARNLLFTDVIVLGIAALGEQYGFLPPVVTTVITVIGLILLLAALWYQFGGGGRSSGPTLGK